MAASIFAVSDFMSKLDNKGSYAKRNRFTVEITKPISLASPVSPSTKPKFHPNPSSRTLLV